MPSYSDPLRDFWHPVALSVDLQDKPVAARLLDVDIVLWRSRGTVVAFKDVCIHRGTPLSLGWITDDQLVCPYHGWCYAATGAVTHIPALPGRRISEKARAEQYHCAERYGLVFVCLGEPRQPLYEIPEFDSPDFKTHIVGPIRWRTFAARSNENFMDDAHLPWVHDGSLGNRENVPTIPRRKVIEEANGFFFETHSEVASRLEPGKIKMATHTIGYRIVLPFTIDCRATAPNGDIVIDLFFSSPVSERQCVRYMVVGRNFALDESSDNFVEFTLNVWEQDRVIIEKLRPEAIPAGLKGEIHMRDADAPSVAYRRMLHRIGITDLPIDDMGSYQQERLASIETEKRA
jgi:phenylpropionate dioxygenase-like ring-hydroxylating dioxygenase large terminal subunit